MVEKLKDIIQHIKDGETLYDNPRVLSIYEIALLTGLDERWLSLATANEKTMRDIIGEAVSPKLIYHLCKGLNISFFFI
jgi:site-specific DNA-cytosine methylase